jgi:hypothetical protein
VKYGEGIVTKLDGLLAEVDPPMWPCDDLEVLSIDQKSCTDQKRMYQPNLHREKPGLLANASEK